MNTNEIKNKLLEVQNKNGIPQAIPDLFYDFYSDMNRKNLMQGGCHFLSSIFHVLLDVFGVENTLYIGNIEIKGKTLSHSWVEINDHVYDIAITQASYSSVCNEGAIFDGVDLNTEKETDIKYGVLSEEELVDNSGKIIENATIGEYFSHCPYGKSYVWDYIEEFSKTHKKYVNISRLKNHYADDKWNRK